MSDLHHENLHDIIFNANNDSVVPLSIFPQLPESGTIQRRAETARIIEHGNPLSQKVVESLGNGLV